MSMHRRAYRELREAGMEENQAEIIASHIPDWSQFATKQDMAELKSEFKQDMAELKSEFKQDIAELKSEFKQDMAELKSELKSEFKQDVAEIKQNMAELKTDLMRWQWVQLGAIVALLAALRFIPFAA